MIDGPKIITIVEDDTIIANVLKNKLEKENYEVKVAKNGESGLKLVKEVVPNLVVLDLILPRMHGFEVLKAIKADPTISKIPVIILTNLGQDEDRQKGLELGAIDYCSKSDIDVATLIDKINEILGK
ncbi:response regulator [Candidatus Falkowbacteria bacterium CG10_big_fil_rev_8_21_14_0_10_39_11]|uniref:Response regulator n=1 Tax=Candidatus Falkowbacteria bacterium CG10_big_fil_rev_8_21_14_0_10_39_11 TaxID=1974565 RepID=A0A2H0V3K5_9BACT|nr:MAG: response regulator [Candidatus Falkowbacteria bacterium CG10_big_fil_rev_8_21_14_0_10_39_11]